MWRTFQRALGTATDKQPPFIRCRIYGCSRSLNELNGAHELLNHGSPFRRSDSVPCLVYLGPPTHQLREPRAPLLSKRLFKDGVILLTQPNRMAIVLCEILTPAKSEM